MGSERNHTQLIAAGTKSDLFGCILTRYAEPLVFILRTLDLVKTLSISLELVRKVIKDLV